jgi:hypothetical protein
MKGAEVAIYEVAVVPLPTQAEEITRRTVADYILARSMTVVR